mgnify:CR=1 FL=1
MKIIDINNQERECDRVFLDPSWPGYVTVIIPSRVNPEKKRTEWIPLKNFIQNNPDFKNKIEGHQKIEPLPPQITGVITTTKINSLSDNTQNWKKNSYAGFYCWISRGTGEGQVRTILSNTKNKLELSKNWAVKPNKNSQYTIVYQKPSVSVMNNTLP